MDVEEIRKLLNNSDMEELLFVVDEFDQPLAPASRSQVIKEKLWRRASGILVANATFDKILCHKRTAAKDERPGVWVSMFGGKCDPGETPDQTVLRELKEESGIALDEGQLSLFAKVKSDKHHQYEYIYWASWAGNIHDLSYDRREVEQIKWVAIDQVYTNLSTGLQDWYCYSQEELAMIQHIQLNAKGS